MVVFNILERLLKTLRNYDERVCEKTPKSIVQVYRIIDKKNEIRWVEDRKTSLFKNGNFKGSDGSVFDISERKLA